MPLRDEGSSPTAFDPTTASLGEFLATVSYSELPPDVIERQRWHLLDTLGCILYGPTTPWVRKVIDALDAHGETGRGSARVPATAIRLPPARATLVTGTAAHSMDYDDYCRDAGVHAGSAVVPVLLAHTDVADDPVSGEMALTAMAAGVEVGIRTGLGIGRDALHRGWHIAGWTGAMAAAATASVLHGFDAERASHALAIAGTQGAGLMGATHGAEVKRFHMGKAAEAGYLAAALAEQSFTGDGKLFGDRWGAIHTTMSGDHDVAAVTRALGERWRLLEKLSFKPFPSVAQTQPPVAAVRQVIEREGIDTEDVAGVRVRVTETAAEKTGRAFEPRGVMAAQSNIPYAVATYLLDGEVSIDAYTEEAIRRSAVLDRVEDIQVVGDDSLRAGDDYQSRYHTVVTVTTTTGETFENEVGFPPGFTENPMEERELIQKFEDQASFVLDDADIDAVIEAVRRFEERDDIMDIFDRLY